MREKELPKPLYYRGEEVPRLEMLSLSSLPKEERERLLKKVTVDPGASTEGIPDVNSSMNLHMILNPYST